MTLRSIVIWVIGGVAMLGWGRLVDVAPLWVSVVGLLALALVVALVSRWRARAANDDD